VFLINYLKELKLTNKAAAKYMRKSESFVMKWGLSKRGFGCLFLFMDNLNAEKMLHLPKMFIEIYGKVF